MRTIKFRAKTTANGRWVYGDSIKHTDNCSCNGIEELTYVGAKVPDARKVGAMKWVVVDPSTIGQFTGLTDCNGKEIYEGDIIDGCFKYDALGGDGGVIPDQDCLCKGVVRFSEERLQWVLDLFWAENHLRKWMEEYEETEIPLIHFEYESTKFPMDLLEVIGNIFDNPELVKQDPNDTE